MPLGNVQYWIRLDGDSGAAADELMKKTTCNLHEANHRFHHASMRDMCAHMRDFFVTQTIGIRVQVEINNHQQPEGLEKHAASATRLLRRRTGSTSSLHACPNAQLSRLCPPATNGGGTLASPNTAEPC